MHRVASDSELRIRPLAFVAALYIVEILLFESQSRENYLLWLRAENVKIDRLATALESLALMNGIPSSACEFSEFSLLIKGGHE
jgi:hypothetical protein